MPKYSFQTKVGKEVVSSINAKSIEEATTIFARIKVLPEEKFLELYEVIER